MAILAFLLFYPVLVVILFGFNVVKSKKCNQPPSPFKLPIIGNLHQLGSLPHRSLQALSNKHGPLMLLHLGSIPTLVVSSAEIAQEILKTHDLVFASRPSSTAAKRLLYGSTDMAFAPHSEYWRQVRKMCVTKLLSAKRVQSFAIVREEEIAIMIKEILASCSISAVNLTEMFLTLLSNIVSRAAFGKKYIERNNGRNSFADLAKEHSTLIEAFSVEDFFPLFGWLDVVSGLDARFKRTSQGIDKFFDQVIDDHLICKTGDGNDEQKDFVDLLLDIQKDCTADFRPSKDNMKALILDMFVGGTETTATTLEWAMAELVKNPNVMVKAQAEVRSVVGRKTNVEEKDILQMDYLKSITKETLRLHPPGPLLLPHESTSSVTLQGYTIPPKTRVFINAWALGRDSRSWENANKFLPERFTNNPIDIKGHDFQLIAFGAGRRSCPGMLFATHIMELALANLLCWFDWELPGGVKKEDLDMSEASGLVVRKKFPLQLVPKYHFS